MDHAVDAIFVAHLELAMTPGLASSERIFRNPFNFLR